MADQKFPEGARVRLKSGGPIMTVGGYGEYDHSGTHKYLCKFWDESKKQFKEETFSEAMLEGMD